MGTSSLNIIDINKIKEKVEPSKEAEREKQKEKERERAAKEAEKQKEKEREKKKSKEKEKKVKSGGARIFNPEEGVLPKIKIKTVTPKPGTPEPSATPKLVIRNLV